jgi:glycosyltransferase involved in cell wall biosynthesis
MNCEPASVPVVVPATETATATIPVLHVINGECYAGAERVQDLLAKNLSAMGFSVGFACVKSDQFDRMRECRDAPLFETPMRGRLDLSAAWRIAKIVREGDYRLLHTHGVRTAMVGGLASVLTGAPMIYHVHSPTSHDSMRRWQDALNGFVERGCLRRASRVIAVSQAMAEHIASEGFDRARIRVVPNGVPALKYVPQRHRPSQCWTLGVVALFRPRKGIEVLLDAMALLLRQGEPVKLRAVGRFESPEYQVEIADRAERLGLVEHITWTGFTQNVGAELQKMDLFVLPSLFGEGLPMVVLEAMAAGVPVVSTRVTGIPEAIRDGVDGLLAAPGDAVDLARAISAMVCGNADWAAMRESAMARQAALFSDLGMARGVANVYREVLAERSDLAAS